MVSTATWILSLKILLISSGVVSLAIALKSSVPLVVNFAVYELPLLWTALLSWLKPPYLYVIINAIIITIAASSRFYHRLDAVQSSVASEPLISVRTPPSAELIANVVEQLPAAGYEIEEKIVEVKQVVVLNDEKELLIMEGNSREIAPVNEDEAEDEDKFLISDSNYTPPPKMIPAPITDNNEPSEYRLLPLPEKPLVSSRFGHRKPLKSSPEGGKGLRVARPRKQETLESTWKMITEGRHVPLTRHLRKSDTFENHAPHLNVSTLDDTFSPPPPQHELKAATFKDRTNYDTSASPVSSGKIRKEPSLSQDELNRRVEAFIRKFNDEMRLQRQQSLQQYKEMITRGAY